MQKVLFFLGVVAVLSSSARAQYSDNQAASFNGTSSCIAVPNEADLNPTTALTLEAWIYPTAYNPAGSGVITKNFATSYWLGYSSIGRVYFYPKGGAGQVLNSKVSTLIQLNTWTHLAATYDGSISRIYINGVEDTSTASLTGAIGVNTDTLYIGAERSSAFFCNYQGHIDEVRLWSVARSAAEIARDRFIPLAIILPPATGTYAGSLNAWRMNGNTNDEAGLNRNDGQARNVSFWDLRQKAVNYIDYNNTLLVNGTDGYCAAVPNTQFDATTAITLEAWVKRDTTSPRNSYAAIITKGGAVGWNYGLYLNSAGGIFFSLNTDVPFLFTGPLVTDTRWTHIAGTYSSTTGKAVIYMNGDSVGGSTFAGNPVIPSTADSVFIGAFRPAAQSNYKFKGQIDQVRIWKNVVRTRDEIRANMYTGINYTTSPAPTGLTVYGFDGRNSSELSPVGYVPQLVFSGTARLTSAHRQTNGELTSPLLRDDAGGFGGLTYVVSRRQMRIPDSDPAGIIDSVFVSASGTATTTKLFLLLNHTFVGDLTVSLTSPTGVSANIVAAQGGGGNDIMAVFDDNADSSAGFSSSSGIRAPFSPVIKPNSTLGVFSGVPRQGWWKLKVIDNVIGDAGTVYGWGVQTSPLVDVDETAGLPEQFELLQNYPNPFNPSTTIKFTVPKESDVSIGVYSVLGQLVTTLVNDRMKAGSYSIQFNGRGFSSGMYFYRIMAGDYCDTKKMLLLK